MVKTPDIQKEFLAWTGNLPMDFASLSSMPLIGKPGRPAESPEILLKIPDAQSSSQIKEIRMSGGGSQTWVFLWFGLVKTPRDLNVQPSWGTAGLCLPARFTNSLSSKPRLPMPMTSTASTDLTPGTRVA